MYEHVQLMPSFSGDLHSGQWAACQEPQPAREGQGIVLGFRVDF